MNKCKRMSALMTAIAVLVVTMIPSQIVQAASNYITVTKAVTPTTMTTAEEAEVTLSIQGSPPVSIIMPNDVILIIDKSGSMKSTGNPDHDDKIAAAKNAAKGFIDMMDMSKHRVGVVDYSSADRVNSFDMTDQAAAAKSYIDNIRADGSTDTGKAVYQAVYMLENHRPEVQPVIVILTDGAANVGPDGVQYKDSPIGFNYAKEAATKAKENGIVFYTIALLGTNEVPESSEPNKLLKEMATTEQHHHFVLGSIGLEAIYQQIVKEIGRASAYNVTVTDNVTPEFEIIPGSADQNIPNPEIDGNTLMWTFQELKDQTLTFKYKIRHKVGAKVGTLPVSINSNITYLDYAGARINKAIQSPYIIVKHLAPVIDSIVSDNGNIAGGDIVTINGKNFRQGLLVKFGSTAATNINFISDAQVTVTAPAGIQGKTTVTLTNDDRQSATTEYGYWAQPVVNSVTPNNGYTTGGTSVRIDGKYFMPGIKVKFGDVPATTVSNGASIINAVTPAVDQPSTVDIVIENEDGTSVTVPGGFTYVLPPSPTITSVTPNNGPIEGRTGVDIAGSNFGPNTEVYFGSIKAIGFNFYSTDKIHVFSPPTSTAGAIEVRVVNEDGQFCVLNNGFTYNETPKAPAPTITTITPDNGSMEVRTKVDITGTDFVPGVKVYFGDNLGTALFYTSNSKISVYSPITTTPGAVDIKVVNPDEQTCTLFNGFTYTEPPKAPAPTITSVTPNTGYTNASHSIYIEGSNFELTSKVFIGTTIVNINFYSSSSKIRVTVPETSQAGAVDITVTNIDGQSATLPGGFTFTEAPKIVPVITTITPNSGFITGGDYITIEGSNFQINSTVFFGNVIVPISYFFSGEKIRIKTPIVSIAGGVDVKVVSTDGEAAIVPGGFTYLPLSPVITAVTPKTGLTSGDYWVDVSGANFQQESKVYFDGLYAPINYIYSSEKIRVTVPARSAGIVDITVENPDGSTCILEQGFTYTEPPKDPEPTITTISPNNGAMGGSKVTITGTNFKPGFTVYFGDTIGRGFFYYSDKKISAYSPASSSAGAVDVRIVNPDGQSVTLSGGFTYNEPPKAAAPTITSLSQSNGSIAGGYGINILGTNFVAGATVYFGNIKANSVIFYSAGRLQAYVPDGSAGVVDVKVVNPDGQSFTLIGGFTYNP